MKINKTYRIPLRYLCCIGKMNHQIIIDFTVKYVYKTNMNKLFESNRQLNPIAVPKFKITFHDAPCIQYEEFRRNDNYQQYLKTIVALEKFLRIGIQQPWLQKSYEMLVGT